MKIRANTKPELLSAELQNALNAIRKERGFDAQEYIYNKASLINEYFGTYGLKAAVVGVSGGIDSSVVLGLLSKCSNIEYIIPVLMPAYDNDGVGNQEEATQLGEEVCKHFNLKPSIVNISDFYGIAEHSIRSSLNDCLADVPTNGSAWARGQLVPYLRTPTLYYHTTLLTDAGIPAVIVGTTNYSEGGYLGYIGKASDGMVDLQVIADIYKNEVYQVAEALELPKNIVNRKPTGDMFEDISDEEVFGATYDFVELFMEMKAYEEAHDHSIPHNLTTAALEEYAHYASSLEDMHSYNKHKYLGASPAVHLDIMPTNLKTWTKNTWQLSTKDNTEGK